MLKHDSEPRLASGDEAVAQAAFAAGVALGTGYPGTPSTEILEAFDAIGGRAQWAPNEKVALEVGIGVGRGGYVRLSITVPLDTIERALPAFQRALKDARG